MNRAQAAGALVNDENLSPLVDQGDKVVNLPLNYTLLSENEKQLRAVFSFHGQAGFERLVGEALHSYATLGALVAGGYQLIARDANGVEQKLGLGLQVAPKP